MLNHAKVILVLKVGLKIEFRQSVISNFPSEESRQYSRENTVGVIHNFMNFIFLSDRVQQHNRPSQLLVIKSDREEKIPGF